MDREKQIDCLHYDKKLNCCTWLSDLLSPTPVLQPCVKSPCEFYKFCKAEIKEMAEIISEPQYDDKTDVLYGYDYEYAMERAEAIYNEGFRKQNEWISVEERLPEDNERVLCFSPSLIESNLGAVSVQSGWCCKRRNMDISHWMPLPEAPKMKDGE